MVVRLRPLPYWKTEAFESWFQQMARKGYILEVIVGPFVHFKKAEAQDIRYRIEATTEKKYPHSKWEFYSECGWNYVTTYNQTYHVYVATDNTVPELHTDSEEEAKSLKSTMKQAAIFAIVFTGIFLFWLLVILFPFWNEKGFYHLLLKRQFVDFTLGLMYFHFFIMYLEIYIYYRKKINRLKNKERKKRITNYKISFLAYPVSFLLIIGILVYGLASFDKNYSQISTSHLSLEEERYLNTVMPFSTEELNYLDGWINKTVFTNKVIQAISVGKDFNMNIKIYEMKFTFLLEKYVNEQVNYYIDRGFSINKLSHPELDYLYEINNKNWPKKHTLLLIGKNKAYYEIEYSGKDYPKEELIDIVNERMNSL